MIEHKTKAPALTNHVPIRKKYAGIGLCVCSVLSGLLAVLMLIAGCRWLEIEWANDWRLSLSLALLGGGTIALAVCLGSAWLARFAFKRTTKSGDA